jgi:hypothetical protein
MGKIVLEKAESEVSVLGLRGHEYRWLFDGNIRDSRQIRFNPVWVKVVVGALDKGINYFDAAFREGVWSWSHLLTEIGGKLIIGVGTKCSKQLLAPPPILNAKIAWTYPVRDGLKILKRYSRV